MIDKINEFMRENKCFIPQYCFFMDDIKITTPNQFLFKELKFFFQPFFSVGFKSSHICEYSISAFMIDELQMIKLFEMLPNGEETLQYVGGNNASLIWRSITCGDITISYMRESFSVIMYVKKDKEFTIMSSKRNLSCIVRKIIREYILYPKLENKATPLLCSTSIFEEKGIMILGNIRDRSRLLIHLLENSSISLVSAGLNFITVSDNKVIMNGTPEFLEFDIRAIQTSSNFYKGMVEQYKKKRLRNEKSLSNFERIHIRPKMISDILNAQITPKAELDKIIFIRLDNSYDIPRIRNIDQKEAFKLLDKSLRNKNDCVETVPWKNDQVPNITKGKIKKSLEAISSHVRFSELCINEELIYMRKSSILDLL